MPMQLGQLEIHPELNEISGPNGRERLEPQAVMVLELLAREPGRVWPRDELLARAWPGRVVSDATLSGVVSRLRRALQAAGVADVRIETRSKRGYRLSVAQAPASRDRSPQRLPCLAGAAAALAILIAGLVFTMAPPALESLEGVRLDFDITFPDGERGRPVIWLEDGGEGRVVLGGPHPLEIRVVPKLTPGGLLRLRIETAGFSHWSGFEQVIALDTESHYTLRAEDGDAAYDIRFIASRAEPDSLPQQNSR